MDQNKEKKMENHHENFLMSLRALMVAYDAKIDHDVDGYKDPFFYISTRLNGDDESITNSTIYYDGRVGLIPDDLR